jgi:hypothetical protein
MIIFNTVEDIDVRSLARRVTHLLQSSGNADVRFERRWMASGDGDLISVQAPIGPELSISLRPRSQDSRMLTLEEIDCFAEDIAVALVTLKKAQKVVRRYAAQMRQAALATLDELNSQGLDMQLTRVGFMPLRARDLSLPDWRDSASRIVCCLDIRHAADWQGFETTTLTIDEPDEVDDEIRSLGIDVDSNQARCAALDAAGIDLVLDSISLDILASHDIDPVSALRALVNSNKAVMKHETNDPAIELYLDRSGEYVTIKILTAKAFWDGKMLVFETADASLSDLKPGCSLGALFPHPAFQARPIELSADIGKPIVTFALDRRVRFNAFEGKIWTEEAAAA